MENNFYENGRLVAGPNTYRIVSSTPGNAVIDACPSANERASWIGQTITLYDDDDFLMPIDLQLPNLSLITDRVIAWYIPSYILVVDAAAIGMNPNALVPFRSNENHHSNYGSVFDDAHDLVQSEGFWTMLVVSGYQSWASEDSDPNGGGHNTGENLPAPSALLPSTYAAIFLEAIRDYNDDDLRTSAWQTAIANIREDLQLVVAHEIGHGPGTKIGEDDHEEMGIMARGTAGAHNFTPETINRFRRALKWLE
jgi:hypothetical protein